MDKQLKDFKLFVVATPIGNIGDISARAVEVLKSVDLILAEDTRIARKLLSFFDVKKPVLSNSGINEKQRAHNIEVLFKKYNKIALVSDSGTPAVSDPGGHTVKAARDCGAEVVAVAGASALAAAISISGILFDSICFLGFLPREANKQKALFKKARSGEIDAFVFYESPMRILKTLKNFEKSEVLEIAVFNDLTKMHERSYVGALQKVVSELIKNEKNNLGEYTVVVKFKKLKTDVEQKILPEALLAQEMIKTKCDLKSAIKSLAQKGLNKNELYKAGLNLKKSLASD